MVPSIATSASVCRSPMTPRFSMGCRGRGPSGCGVTSGHLYPGLATEAELRGERVFNEKGNCASCHAAPYFTDNQMHDLRAERFFTPRTINDMLASTDGAIKTFPLRGILHSPPYLHDGRLLTLEDTVEFFNLVTERHLTVDEKADLVAFLRIL